MREALLPRLRQSLPEHPVLLAAGAHDALSAKLAEEAGFDAVDVPVVADCDNGYGNAINVMRTVTEFERAGAAGICIEDNEFPKRCSFYAGVRRELVPVGEHARKI